MIPARLPFSQCLVNHTTNVHPLARGVTLSRHPPFVYRWAHESQPSLRIPGSFNDHQGFRCSYSSCFGHAGSDCQVLRWKTIDDQKKNGVASNPPAFLGNRILLMVRDSSRSCPTNKGKASTISSSSCAYEARASEGTTQQSKDKHCSGQLRTFV